MPDHAPQLKIFRASDEHVVYNQLVPVVDRTIQVGVFASRVFLGNAFAVGMHSLTMQYRVGSKIGLETRVFEITPGGDPRGCVLGMYYLHKPQADNIIYQTESGTIERGRNPRVN